MTYVVAAAAAGTFSDLAEFVVLWFVLEFLLYYARYQWNDIRGATIDRNHPERLLRARLPVGTTEEEHRLSVNVSSAAVAVRMLLAIIIALALGVVEVVLILAIAVWSIAIVYEFLRSRPPAYVVRTAGWREVGVWLAVGLGYMVRGGLGLALAGVPNDTAGKALGLAFFFSFGTMYVLLSWALEASNFCTQIGSRWTVAEGLSPKPHLSALLRYLDGSRAGGPAFTTTPKRVSRTAPGYLGDTRVLDACHDFACPWNIALLVGAVLSGLLGAKLAGSTGAAGAVLCLGGATGLCRSKRSAIRWTAVAAVAAALDMLAIVTGAASAWVTALPWLAIAGCYARFRSMSYLDSMGS